MLAYGGNGPAFAGVQAEELGIVRVMVPKASPAFSALGTLVANPSIDEERSYIAPADALDLGKLSALWSDLAESARGHFAVAGFAESAVQARYQIKHALSGPEFRTHL